MNLRFEKSFQKDLRKIKDKNMLTRIKAVITESKKANVLSEINGLIKLKGYNTFYRIRLAHPSPPSRWRVSFGTRGNKTTHLTSF